MATTMMDVVRSTQDRDAVNSALSDWLDEITNWGDRNAEMQVFQQYYDGVHNVELTDRAREYLEAADSGIDFTENFCEVIVDSLAERISVLGFTAEFPGDEGDDKEEALAQLMMDWWRQNRMTAKADTVHTISLITSEAFIIVEWDKEANRPRFVHNRPEKVKAFYSDDDPDLIEMAVKKWNSKDRGLVNPDGKAIERVNVYFPDRIERYYRLNTNSKGGWAQWRDELNLELEEAEDALKDPDGVPFPVNHIPWTDDEEQPLGVPVIHFRNRPLGRVEGRSELRSDIPMQDEMNKIVVDHMMVLDGQGWPQRYLIGDESSAPDLKMAPGNVWGIKNPAAKFGQFDAADPSGLLASLEGVLSRRARRSRTPLHLLTGGDMPSGEALDSAQAGQVNKAEKRQEVFGDDWEDMMFMGFKLGATFGEDFIEVDLNALTIETLWKPAASRNEKREAETAVMLHQVGASKHTLLERLGFDPDDEADLRKEEARQGAANMAKFMAAGGPPNDEEDDDGGNVPSSGADS